MSNVLIKMLWRVIFILVFGWLLILLLDTLRVGFDDTDNPDTGERSGVMLITDYGTGCQYLKGIFGPPIPRMNAEGKQICKQ